MSLYIVVKKSGMIQESDAVYTSQGWIETNWTNPDEFAEPWVHPIGLPLDQAQMRLNVARKTYPAETYTLMEVSNETHPAGITSTSSETQIEVERG